MEKICRILENLQKTFFTGKKSDFNFQNPGYFGQKKFPFFFFFRKKVLMEKIWGILENLQKLFLVEKKSDFKFQNREYF